MRDLSATDDKVVAQLLGIRLDVPMGTRQLRHPVAPRHWLVIAIVLFVLTFALGFLVRLVPSIGTAQLPLDIALNRQHSSALDALAGTLDHLDQPVVVAVILLVMFAVLWLLKEWRAAIITCIVAGAGWVSCLVVKYIVHEPRPVIADLPHSLSISPSTFSFPSGHVALVAAFATALFLVASRRAPRVTIVVVFALFALLVGASRLYIGLHYLTDTIGGALNGVAGAVLVAGLISLVLRWRERRREPRDEPPREAAVADEPDTTHPPVVQ